MQQNNQNQSNINPNTKPYPLASEQVKKTHSIDKVDIKQEITNKIKCLISLFKKGRGYIKI